MLDIKAHPGVKYQLAVNVDTNEMVNRKSILARSFKLIDELLKLRKCTEGSIQSLLRESSPIRIFEEAYAHFHRARQNFCPFQPFEVYRDSIEPLHHLLLGQESSIHFNFVKNAVET